MSVFADTTFFVALMDEDDQWHEQAQALLAFAEKWSPLQVHALAVGEVIAIIGSHKGGKAARQAYAMLKDTVQIHVPTIDDLDAAMEHVLRYDGTLSLSDALYLHMMKLAEAKQIISFDDDFDGKCIERISDPPNMGPKPPSRRSR
ncbi:MAG: type II toxin-antitoxin system VapC family toxin [Candidatus Thermoplasmatota archaeon]